jgi:hypothetical protein
MSSNKISIENALAEYTTKELIEFHANLNAIFIAVNEDFGVFPLLLRVHFALSTRESIEAEQYLEAVNKMFNIPV